MSITCDDKVSSFMLGNPKHGDIHILINNVFRYNSGTRSWLKSKTPHATILIGRMNVIKKWQ